MKKSILTLMLIVFGNAAAFSMCTPTITGCTSTYASTADAICNGPVITQDGACVTANNTGSTACITGGCFDADYNHSQFYMQFTPTTAAIIIDFTSLGIQNADVAIITNGAGGCGDPVSVCPAAGSLCIESCNTSAGGGPVSINPTTLTPGETYILAIETENNVNNGCDPLLGNDEGSFQICITTDPCRDGIQNNGETGIDCGGPCSPCSATNDSCMQAIPMVLDATLAIGSGATNSCVIGTHFAACTDPGTEDCCIATGMAACGSPTGCCVVSYMSCGSVENNTWFTYTPTVTDSFNFALTNQSCTAGNGMQMWLGTLPSGCGDACTYNEIYCQSTATTADINYAAYLTAGVTYYITLDGFAGDDCSFDFGVYSNNPLPIELVNYYGEYNSKSKNVLLKWMTSTEINNDFFTIERGNDGINFEVLETVNAGGNSKILKSYKFVDNNPITGVNYYRLKQTDIDGTTTNNGIVAVNVSEDADIKLYPTATTSDVKLELFMGAPTYTEVSVYNTVGILVFHEKMEIGKGISSFVIPSSDFEAGVYFVRVNGIDNVDGTSLKFIKN